MQKCMRRTGNAHASLKPHLAPDLAIGMLAPSNFTVPRRCSRAAYKRSAGRRGLPSSSTMPLASVSQCAEKHSGGLVPGDLFLAFHART